MSGVKGGVLYGAYRTRREIKQEQESRTR